MLASESALGKKSTLRAFSRLISCLASTAATSQQVLSATRESARDLARSLGRQLVPLSSLCADIDQQRRSIA
nr:hypothetical protein CFP56_71246 [Quercus suber]